MVQYKCSQENYKINSPLDFKRGFSMYDLIYSVMSVINLGNSLMVDTTIKNLEVLLEGIIPNVYFTQQKNEHITWIIKAYGMGEICRVIIGKKTFEIV